MSSAPLRVLMVEDVEADAVLLARALRRDGQTPLWRRVDTEAGLRVALAEATWDIVLSDYFMPAFSGIDALHVVREMAPGTPFIIVSGMIGERTAVEAMRAGAHDFFVKGKVERLLLAVERELRDADNRRRTVHDAAALDALQQQMSNFMDHAPVPIWIKDAALRYVYANPAHCRLLDCTSDDLVGRTDAMLMPPQAAQGVQEQDRLALKLQTVLRSEHELHHSRRGLKTLDVIRFPVTRDPQTPLVAGMAIDMSERLSYEARLLEANARLQRLSSQVIEVQERERKTLARDLHDDIGQSLTALKITLDSLVRDATLDARAGSAIDTSRGIVTDVIGRIRSMSLALRPPQLDDLGLAATLQFHMERQCALAGIGLRFEGSLDGERPHPDIENTCFRIAQEAFTNIARHAKARRLECRLTDNDERIQLTMRDDGCGFDVERAVQRAVRGDSSGLLNMRERAALVGGAVTIVSWTNEGSCLDIVLPKQPQRALS